MGIFGALGGAMGLGAFARGGGAVAGYGGGRPPQQPALWPQMPPETGPPPGMSQEAWNDAEAYLNHINPGRAGNTGALPHGADMPYTERQGDWDVTSGGFAGHMTRQNPQTGEQQYFDKRSGQWVSGPMFQQTGPTEAPPLQPGPDPGPTVQGPTPMGEFGGTWGAGSQQAALQQAAQAAYGMPGTGGLPYGQKPQMDANWAAYRGPGMLPLGFFGQGPAGWGQAARGMGGAAYGGSSYAPWSTGRTFGSRY